MPRNSALGMATNPLNTSNNQFKQRLQNKMAAKAAGSEEVVVSPASKMRPPTANVNLQSRPSMNQGMGSSTGQGISSNSFRDRLQGLKANRDKA